MGGGGPCGPASKGISRDRLAGIFIRPSRRSTLFVPSSPRVARQLNPTSAPRNSRSPHRETGLMPARRDGPPPGYAGRQWTSSPVSDRKRILFFFLAIYCLFKKTYSLMPNRRRTHHRWREGKGRPAMADDTSIRLVFDRSASRTGDKWPGPRCRGKAQYV